MQNPDSNSIHSRDLCSDTLETQDQSGETAVFQFIDISSNDPDTQNKIDGRRGLMLLKSLVGERKWKRSGSLSIVLLQPTERSTIRRFSQRLPYSINQSLLESASSPWSHILEDIVPTVRSKVKWSPLVDLMVHHIITVVIATLLTGSSGGKPSSAVLEAWQTIRCSAMVTHAMICGVAVHRDSLHAVGDESKSHEVLTHHRIALHLIENELSTIFPGNKPSDALLFSILGLVSKTNDEWQLHDTNNSNTHPFRLSQLHQGWEKSFVRVRYNKAHYHGLVALIGECGGLVNLESRWLVKMISDLDLLMSTQELHQPLLPYIELEEIANLTSDPNLNILDSEPSNSRAPGSSLPYLQRSLDPSSDLARILPRLQRIFAASDALVRGTLRNFNVQALIGEKGSLNHAILSIPPRPDRDDLYGPVRLTTLILNVGILFPLPPVTGVLGRLVHVMKNVVDVNSDMSQLPEDRTEVMIWILFIAGITAKGMSERTWFVDQLRSLVDRLRSQKMG